LLWPAPDLRDMATTPWFLRARLRTRHLMLLIAIGEGGNIHKAAQMMNMSQPAASRLLNDIEDIIGAALFDRLPRGVRANRYGEALIRHARIALASLNEAASEIDLLKSGQTGHVTVGSIEGPAIGFVPRAIAQVLRRDPLIRVQLQVDTSDKLLESLNDGTLDLMVGRLGRGDQSGFEYECLADEPVCAAVRPNHPLLQQHDLSLRDLAELPWIVPAVGNDLRHRFDLMFRDTGIACPAQIMEAESKAVIIRLLEETDHLALLPGEVAEYYSACEMVSILPIRLGCKMDSYGIITRKGRMPSPSASLVRAALAAAAAELKPGSAVEGRKRKVRDAERVLPTFSSRLWQLHRNGEPVR
jgi:DNA-binding transcriptional LysR family regulator